MDPIKRRRISIGLAGAAMAAGVIAQWYDTPLLAVAIAAAGMLWSTREWRAWVFASVLVGAGLFWSSLDSQHCSAWWKGRIVAAKLSGGIPYVSWDSLGDSIFGGCYDYDESPAEVADHIELIDEKTVGGRGLEQYRTAYGDFWIAAPGKETLAWLIWEFMYRADYEGIDVAVQPGDVVVDAGAHIGIFTRYALARGAASVIAIEPDPINLYCFEANLAEEIASGKVTLIKAGIWDSRSTLTLYQSEDNSAANSFVYEFGQKVDDIPVLPLDDIVEELGLETIDFVKMDIEGSERRALRGAGETLRRFKPDMAICTYHRPDDAETVSRIITELQPEYRFHATRIYVHGGRVSPKVLFFN